MTDNQPFQLYRTEFEDFLFPCGVRLPSFIQDKSCANNAMPCWGNDKLGIELFVNYSDESKCEIEGGSLFNLQYWDVGTDEKPDSKDNWFSTNDYAVVLTFIAEQFADALSEDQLQELTGIRAAWYGHLINCDKQAAELAVTLNMASVVDSFIAFRELAIETGLDTKDDIVSFVLATEETEAVIRGEEEGFQRDRDQLAQLFSHMFDLMPT